MKCEKRDEINKRNVQIGSRVKRAFKKLWFEPFDDQGNKLPGRDTIFICNVY